MCVDSCVTKFTPTRDGAVGRVGFQRGVRACWLAEEPTIKLCGDCLEAIRKKLEELVAAASKAFGDGAAPVVTNGMEVGGAS